MDLLIFFDKKYIFSLIRGGYRLKELILINFNNQFQ